MKKSKGIRLQLLNVIMVLIAGSLSFYLLYSTYRTIVGYDIMRAATENYITCHQSAGSMQDASDYLTEQVRSFAVTGDPQDAERYFEEANVNRRRDLALEAIREQLAGTEAYQALSDALERSNRLMEREYYSMRLVIDAKGYDLEAYPPEIRQAALSPEDAALSPEKKMELARSLVFDDVYREAKTDISADIARCLDTLERETHARQIDSSDQLLELLRRQYILIGLMLLIVLAVVLLTTLLIVRPLKNSISHIENNQELPLTGSYELQYLARTYNSMYEKTMLHQNKLSYDATHDALTGLLNRGVFDSVREACDSGNSAMLLIDLDHFKDINDTYGHETGDLALKKVAELLQKSFRSEDYICRVGGDEFAVIMVHATSALRDLVADKIDRINEKLLQPEGGLPAFSLSVGVAFGDRENPTDDLYRDADQALYRVKNTGRGGCEFY